MSAATKRKHVVKQMLEDFSMPKPHQTIVQVLGNAGSNLHKVLTPDGQNYLASLPVQFRKNMWIKRGDYVVVEPITEGNKVKAEIVRVLYPQHIKEIKQSKLWPSRFECAQKHDEKTENVLEKPETKCSGADDGSYGDNLTKERNSDSKRNVASDSEEESEDDFSDIPPNNNRPVEIEYESDEETSDEN